MKEMKTFDRQRIGELMKAVLEAGKTLVVPWSDGKFSEFRAVNDPDTADLEIRLTKVPLKTHFLPATECLLKYRKENGEVVVEETPAQTSETVIFGARPCDAASLPVMDKVFTWDYMDDYYLARRANATIVTIACDTREPSCRCENVGLSPVSKEGSDVFILPIGNGSMAVEALTEKGEKLVSLWAGRLNAADAGETAAAEKMLENSVPDTSKAAALRQGLKERFESPEWNEAVMKCLGCGACAYLCPTCHCFDIVDEKTGHDCGERRRNWDACAFNLFTMHGSMHNPRSAQWHRYRQRLMHKFEYYPEKFGVTACVGCGRCLVACPAGMDIFEVIERVSAR